MKTYRLKWKTVQAERCPPTMTMDEMVHWLHERMVTYGSRDDEEMTVCCLDGFFSPGYWLVTHDDGYREAYLHETFEETFEPVSYGAPFAGDKKALSEEALEAMYLAREEFQNKIQSILGEQDGAALEAFAGPMTNEEILDAAHHRHFYEYLRAKAHLTIARRYHRERSKEIEAGGGSGAYCVFHASDLRDCADKHGFDKEGD